jgi:hypothetical protein
MPKRIRIVETVVYDYEPDFAENCYAANNITTVEAALEVDKALYWKMIDQGYLEED